MAKIDLAGRSENSVARDAGIALSTLRRRIANPGSTTMDELLRIAECTDRDPDELFRAIIGDQRTDAHRGHSGGTQKQVA